MRILRPCLGVLHFPSCSRASWARNLVIFAISPSGSDFSKGNWIEPLAVLNARRVGGKRRYRGRRGVKTDVILVRREGHQYPAIGKGRHAPFQALRRPGCRGANARTHLAQFLPRLFGAALMYSVVVLGRAVFEGMGDYLLRAVFQSVTRVMGGCSVTVTPGRRNLLPSGCT